MTLNSVDVMALAATILVEGNADHRFIEQYLEHLGQKQSIPALVPETAEALESEKEGKIYVRKIGGNETKLFSDRVFPILKGITKSSRKTLVLLDANSKPQKKRENVYRLAEERGLDAESFALFLLPNDKDEGELENLLLQISPGDHGIHQCFDAYLKCLRKIDKDFNFSSMPGDKEKIYAYCKIVFGKPPEKCDFQMPH